ncbi:MAG: hypothetical protein D6763_11820 [Alphaproteobacteria bacterium]|nr:MAG: hypothetical protein D6763_11820 [Alphaproteobacteria bacterium]
MAFFIYQPHIHKASKRITPDILIRSAEAVFQGGEACPLRVGNLSTAIEQEVVLAQTVIAPGLGLLAGQDTNYVVPAFLVLEERLLEAEQGLAVRTAPVVLMRFGWRLDEAGGKPIMFRVSQDGDETPPMTMEIDDGPLGRGEFSLNLAGPFTAVIPGPLDVRVSAEGQEDLHTRFVLQEMKG